MAKIHTEYYGKTGGRGTRITKRYIEKRIDSKPGRGFEPL